MSDLKLGAPDCLDKHREIKETVQSVKVQEDRLMERLTHEQICLERELNIGGYHSHCRRHSIEILQTTSPPKPCQIVSKLDGRHWCDIEILNC